MKKRGYLIRANGDGLPATIEDCIRITLGPENLIQNFLEDLDYFLEGAED